MWGAELITLFATSILYNRKLSNYTTPVEENHTLHGRLTAPPSVGSASEHLSYAEPTGSSKPLGVFFTRRSGEQQVQGTRRNKTKLG